MPVDPRLNCAAEICCPPPAAKEAKIQLVEELIVDIQSVVVKGVGQSSRYLGELVVDRMKELDIEFAPGELMRAIRNLADHPNSKVKEKGGNISPEEAEKVDLNS